MPDGSPGWFPNADWGWGNIRMCISSDHGSLSSLPLEVRQGVFIHEIGHALKLDHPNHLHDTDSLVWQPASNMLTFVNAVRPRGYDKFNLIMKWGE